MTKSVNGNGVAVVWIEHSWTTKEKKSETEEKKNVFKNKSLKSIILLTAK